MPKGYSIYLSLQASIAYFTGCIKTTLYFISLIAGGTLDQDIRPVLEKRFLQHKPATSYRFKFRTYLDLQLTLCIALLTFITATYSSLGLDDKLFIVFFMLLTLINCGALMEQRKWIYYLECIRLIVLLSYIFSKLDIFGLIILPAVALVILESLFSLSHLYRNYVLKYEKIYKE